MRGVTGSATASGACPILSRFGTKSSAERSGSKAGARPSRATCAPTLGHPGFACEMRCGDCSVSGDSFVIAPAAAARGSTRTDAVKNLRPILPVREWFNSSPSRYLVTGTAHLNVAVWTWAPERVWPIRNDGHGSSKALAIRVDIEPTRKRKGAEPQMRRIHAWSVSSRVVPTSSWLR